MNECTATGTNLQYGLYNIRRSTSNFWHMFLSLSYLKRCIYARLDAASAKEHPICSFSILIAETHNKKNYKVQKNCKGTFLSMITILT